MDLLGLALLGLFARSIEGTWSFGKFKDLKPPKMDGTFNWASWERDMPGPLTINFAGKYTADAPVYSVDCDDAPESCQNLCWYSYCRQNTMTFACGGGGARGDSGCQYAPCSDNMNAQQNCKKHETCWYVFHGGKGNPDVQDVENDNEEEQYNGSPECDEFPANAFNMVAGARRSLRCIGDKDNKSSGQDYKAACKQIKEHRIAEARRIYQASKAQWTNEYNGLLPRWRQYREPSIGDLLDKLDDKIEDVKRRIRFTDDEIWALVEWPNRRFNLRETYPSNGDRSREGYCRVPTANSFRPCLWELPPGKTGANLEDPYEKNVAQFYWIDRGSAQGGTQKNNYFVQPPWWVGLTVLNPSKQPGKGIPVYDPNSLKAYNSKYAKYVPSSRSGQRRKPGYRKRSIGDLKNTTEPIPESDHLDHEESDSPEDDIDDGSFGGGPLTEQSPQQWPEEERKLRRLLLSDGRIIEDDVMRAGRGDGLLTRVNGTRVILDIVREL